LVGPDAKKCRHANSANTDAIHGARQTSSFAKATQNMRKGREFKTGWA